MIHEFIDNKKKSKNSGTTNGKTLRDSIETCSGEQSGSEWPSTTFIAPWLNNLGLKLKNNQMYGALDQRTEKLHPDAKNLNQDEANEGEERKSTFEEDQSKRSCYCENSLKGCEEEKLVQISESYQKLQSTEKQSRETSNSTSQIPVFWQVRSRVGDAETSSSDSIMSPLLQKKKNFKATETEVGGKALANVSQLKNDQERKQKLAKKSHRIKYRTTSRQESLSREIDVDSLLEEKAKKVLENYPKKKNQSAASDIKRFEAKLLLLHTKISLGKLTPEDMRFLQEIKARAGSKENFDKLMRHVREVNLKEILETDSSILKSVQAKKDVENSNAQKKALLSTDDENDIKRFSDTLKKNLNKEEKRKCLEEVRNYFEKKRRTRLTKCWTLNPNSKESDIEREKNDKNGKTNVKNVFSDRSATDWRAKFKINDAEVVGKAVDETLQKFVELYHFHVSPSLMSSMKKNVLKGIQSKPFEGDQALTWHLDIPSNVEGDKLSTKLKKKDLKTKSLKDRTLLGSQLIRRDGLESEEIKSLKSELECYFNNANEDVTKLKVQGIILEEENQYPRGKNVVFIYSFTKKSLEQINAESIAGATTTLPLKDVEVQVDKFLNATNAKTQTQNLRTVYERQTQTENNSQESVDVQTEGTYAIEVKKLKDSDVSPGLYRMIRSKQAGRFYLYPENEEYLISSGKVTNEGNKSNTFEERKFSEKKLNRTSEESEPDKKKRDENVSDVLIVNGTKLEKEVGATSVPENKQECIWLWDGKKISSGTDLKAHVESLLKEKLKEISHGSEESGKDKSNLLTHNFAKAPRTGSQDNLEFTILHSGFPLENEHVGSRLENKIRNCGEGSAGTQSLGEPRLTSEEKLLKNASTQNSEPAGFPVNVKTWKPSVKSQTSSKTYFRKKRRVKTKRDRQSRQSISDLKKAMQLMSECLTNKRMKFEVDSSPKESICDSGTTLESNTSSYSKDTSDDHFTLIFGLKDNSTCKNKRYRRTIDEEVQTHSGKNSGIKNLVDTQRMENHMYWELIERVLHRVNCKKRRSLWNDVRELIKSKIGKDIDREDAKEVCIQIEQDMRGVLGGKSNNSVLAKGYYAKNEGDIEVEIDLTLKDLERIIRRRERNRRRRNLYYTRNSRSLRSSSPGQSRSNFTSIQEFRNILRSVPRSRPTPLPRDVRIIKMNKEN